ncbi:hypothetical protein FKP32DRAFT_1593182 [Trametes sanguinea]|nr:hypothetical protein FKP32DRAFT_1593182 [Trametes sanguinea]
MGPTRFPFLLPPFALSHASPVHLLSSPHCNGATQWPFSICIVLRDALSVVRRRHGRARHLALGDRRSYLCGQGLIGTVTARRQDERASRSRAEPVIDRCTATTYLLPAPLRRRPPRSAAALRSEPALQFLLSSTPLIPSPIRSFERPRTAQQISLLNSTRKICGQSQESCSLKLNLLAVAHFAERVQTVERLHRTSQNGKFVLTWHRCRCSPFALMFERLGGGLHHAPALLERPCACLRPACIRWERPIGDIMMDLGAGLVAVCQWTLVEPFLFLPPEQVRSSHELRRQSAVCCLSSLFHA